MTASSSPGATRLRARSRSSPSQPASRGKRRVCARLAVDLLPPEGEAVHIEEGARRSAVGEEPRRRGVARVLEPRQLEAGERVGRRELVDDEDRAARARDPGRARRPSAPGGGCGGASAASPRTSNSPRSKADARRRRRHLDVRGRVHTRVPPAPRPPRPRRLHEHAPRSRTRTPGSRTDSSAASSLAVELQTTRRAAPLAPLPARAATPHGVRRGRS